MLMGCRTAVDGKGEEHTFFAARDAASQVKLVQSHPSPLSKASVGAGRNSGVASALEREAHVRALGIIQALQWGTKSLEVFSPLSPSSSAFPLSHDSTPGCNRCCWFEISWETFKTNRKRG